jgi:hypothetical protein
MILVRLEPMMIIVRMSAISARASVRGKMRRVSSGVETARANSTGPDPRLRSGVVEGDREVGVGGEAHAAFDQRPGLEIVREVDRAKIMAERRAGAGACREHRGDAGEYADVEIAPFLRAGFERFEYRGGHREHAGIARGHDDHAVALGRELERVRGAVEFDAVVGRVERQAVAGGDARDIGDVADDVGRFGERGGDFGRHQVWIAGAEPCDRQPAGHGRRPCPWISRIEK